MTNELKLLGWPKWLPWEFGQRVTKRTGSSWTGQICGWYTTTRTEIGFCVESENEPGSVHLYPMKALMLLQPPVQDKE